jgi:hypothetical protein
MKKLTMLKAMKIKQVYWLLPTFFGILIILGLYPGLGGEGAQRNISIYREKMDNSGFLVPLIYGYWPDFIISWLYSFAIFQITIFSIGMKLIFNKLEDQVIRKIFMLIYIFGAIFLLQVVRDATAFSLFILAFGITLKASSSKDIAKLNYSILGICLIIIGCLFKPIVAPIVGLIYLLVFEKQYKVFQSNLVRTLVVFTIAFCPFLIDKAMTSELKLNKGYAEQQLFIYDITKMYCWGHDYKSVEFAKSSIKPFLRIGADHESLCASLEPMSWDDLRRSLPEVSKSPAVVWHTGDDPTIVNKLISDWIKLIRLNPFEWLQIKVIDASQVLVMANAFYIAPVVENDKSNLVLTIGDSALKLIFIPINILDKLRIFSLGFALLIGLAFIFINGRFIKFDKKIDSIIYKFILINLFTWFMLTVLFIANPGRYTLPFVFLSYIYLMVSLDLNYNKRKINLIKNN